MYAEWLEKVRQNRETWCESLESDEYTQGTEYLCRVVQEESLYCCLGLALHLKGREYVINNRFNNRLLHYQNDRGNFNSCQYPPKNFMLREYGLDETQWEDLANRNDGSSGYAKHTFKEIATIIRSLPLPSEEEYNGQSKDW